MPGSAAPAAMVNLAAAWTTALADGTTIKVGTPPGLQKLQAANFVTGEVTDWTQTWGVTPHVGTGLDGGRNEDFVLTCRIYRARIDGTIVALMNDIAPARQALEAALRNDPTLGGALSTSGMAQIVRMEQFESVRDDRALEIGLSVYVGCAAWIS